MAVSIQAPKGTKDILPDEVWRWQYVEGIMRRKCDLYGFREIRTPVFEHTELFNRGVGDTTDVVQKEMYTFEDKGGRSITLRPEGTAGVARSYIESDLAGGPQPVKLYYLPLSVFRYEKPQAGRLREHHQFGVEMFGAEDPTADAEIISLALDVIRTLGINDLTVHINSIGCRECRQEYNKKLVEYFESKKGRLCKTCQERLYRNPLRILDCKEEECKEICKDAPLIIDNLCDECRAHFEKLKDLLESAGIEYSIDPFIVRGLDYYTKTVFEIIYDNGGMPLTVCGGGRYDGLISEIGGPERPGIGFGMGIERLLLVLEGAGIKLPEPEGMRVFVATMGDEARKTGYGLVSSLRAHGIKADMDHAARSMKAQFKYAGKINARYVIVVGQDEMEKGIVQVRDMLNSTQSEVVMDKILEAVE